jgi:hypothetical protein
MTYSNDELSQLQILWQAEAEMTGLEAVEIPEPPQVRSPAVPIPIPSQARQVAAQFAEEQPTPEKAVQVRCNTLAVIAVRDYLQFQGYIPDVAASDCWQPILRRLDDVADLEVSGVGRLECRAFKPGEDFCAIPENVQSGRVGYIAVELAAEDHWAWLLGFLPSFDPDSPVAGLRRAELHSMDELGEHLRRLWLLGQIVPEVLQEQGEAEPWAPEFREEVIALLEGIYRTHSPAERSYWAAEKIVGLELEASVERQDMATAGSREHAEAETGNKLRSFLREVFDRLMDELEEG